MKQTDTQYRWVIMGACVAIMFVVWGLGNHPLGLYTVPVTEAFGFPRSLFAVIFSIINLFTAFGSLFFGPAVQKLGLKRLMLIGSGLCVAAYLLFYFAGSLAMFYCGAALFGLSLAFTTNNPVSVLVNNWFTKGKGMALGIVFAASGIGGTVCDIAVGQLLNRFGFRTALGISGVIIAAVLAVAMVLVRPRPPQEKAPSDAAPQAVQLTGVSFERARKTASFWLMAATELLWGLSIIPIVATMPAFLSDKGIDPLFISGVIMSSLFAVSALSKIMMGVVNDKLGPMVMLLILGGSGAAATLMLVLLSGPGGMVASALLMGVAFACMTVPLPLLTIRIFGNKAYAALLGVFSATLTLAGAAGTPLSSMVFDLTGSYLPAFLAQAAFFALSAVTGIQAVLRRPKWDKPEDPADAPT